MYAFYIFYIQYIAIPHGSAANVYNRHVILHEPELDSVM